MIIKCPECSRTLAVWDGVDKEGSGLNKVVIGRSKLREMSYLFLIKEWIQRGGLYTWCASDCYGGMIGFKVKSSMIYNNDGVCIDDEI